MGTSDRIMTLPGHKADARRRERPYLAYRGSTMRGSTLRIGRLMVGLGCCMALAACLPPKRGDKPASATVKGGSPAADTAAASSSNWTRWVDWTRYHPDPNFVDLYAELKLASVALSQDLDKASEIRRVILAQHGMTPAEFHEHFMRLADHPEAWRPFQEQVVARIDALQPKPVATGKE